MHYICLNTTKQPWHILVKNSPIIPREWWKVPWFGRTWCDKQTNHLSLIACAINLNENKTLMIKFNCEFFSTNMNLFLMTKLFQIRYLPHLRSKNYRSHTSKKSHSWWAFQQYQELAPISLNWFCWIFFWQNCSIFNNSCTLCLNQTSAMHPYSLKLFNTTKITTHSDVVWEISMWETNKLPSIIDGYYLLFLEVDTIALGATRLLNTFSLPDESPSIPNIVMGH